jgi:hypothetical protein
VRCRLSQSHDVVPAGHPQRHGRLADERGAGPGAALQNHRGLAAQQPASLWQSPAPEGRHESLEADVIQDRRAIWEWALEPLLAAKERWKVPSGVAVDTGS